MSLPIGSCVGAQADASEYRKVPVPTKVGPLTRRGGGFEILLAGDGGAMRPALAFAGTGVQVIVRSEDAPAARDILDIPAKTPRPTA
jgi:hypothetical protein